MSYILNALRKSELERQSGQPESLENKIQDKPIEIQGKSSRWIVVLVFMNFLFLSYFIWSSTREPNNEEIRLESDNIINQGHLSSTALTQPEYQEKPLSIAEQLKRKKNQRQQTINHKPKQTALPKVIKPIKNKTSVNTTEKTIKKNVTRRITTVKPKAKLKPLPVIENKPPFLSELDYEFRRKTPPVDINVFVFSEHEDSRFIMLNMKKFVIEQDIMPGMKLKEIRKNSIVVSYKGKMFQIQR